MTRKELEEYIYKTYKVRPDYPWKRDRENGVFHKPDISTGSAFTFTISIIFSEPVSVSVDTGGAGVAVNMML